MVICEVWKKGDQEAHREFCLTCNLNNFRLIPTYLRHLVFSAGVRHNDLEAFPSLNNKHPKDLSCGQVALPLSRRWYSFRSRWHAPGECLPCWNWWSQSFERLNDSFSLFNPESHDNSCWILWLRKEEIIHPHPFSGNGASYAGKERRVPSKMAITETEDSVHVVYVKGSWQTYLV